MPDPYLASNDFPGDGVTTLRTVSFKGNRPDAAGGTVPYLSASDVKASKITPATPTTPETEVALTVAYVGPNQFNVTPACPVGTICRVYRATQDEYNLVDYQSLQNVGESDLDLANRQTIFIVQEARDLAQRAKADIQNATTVAYEAISTANDAMDTADASTATAAAALSTAQSAVITANAASSAADGAVAAAAAATDTANAIAGTANDAFDAAAAAVVTANDAAATANAIAGTANTALSTANAAVSTANSAVSTANAAQATATNAENTANAIAGTANTALANSSTALSTANTALATANSFESRVASLESSQVTQNTNITNLQTDNATQASQISVLQSGKQPLDATLTGLAALSIAANQVPLGSGTDTFTTIASGATGRALLQCTSSNDVATNLPDFYRRTNVVGTVSLSGGTPTGTVLERGSNGNGEYIKFTDGTLMCWKQHNLGPIAVTTADGTIFRSGFVSAINFAHAFSGSPVVHMTLVSSTGTSWMAAGSAFPTATATQSFLCMNATAGTITYSLMIFAIGRWA